MIRIIGNGVVISTEDIVEQGACPSSNPTQPTALIFSDVTDKTMKISFKASTQKPNGYITLMRAYGSPYPEDTPIDGTTYHVGNVLGSSTIVVGVGGDTSLNIMYLNSGTDYYFDVFSYSEHENGLNYLTTNPLEGSQRTAIEMVQPVDLTFSDVTSHSLTVSFTAPLQLPTGYITVMRAYGSPYPEDAPVDGTTYHVGNVLGSSTIVVGVGSETSLDIVYLGVSIDYYFDVFSYTSTADGYDYLTLNPLAGNQRTSSDLSIRSSQARTTPFPNPFSEDITIPFTTTHENTFVQIVISDPMGQKIADVVNENFTLGYHEVRWNGMDNNQGNRVKQGLYMYLIKMSETDHILRGMLVAK